MRAAAKPKPPVERELAGAVRRLVDAFDPERIYLFGSRARGDATEDSDYDLMVVVSEMSQAGRQLHQQAYRALEDIRIPVQPFVWSLERFERQLPVVASFPATIVREGRLLYDSRRARAPIDGRSSCETASRLMQTEQQRAQLTREWLVKASRDLAAADLAVGADPPLPDVAAFHCQQAFEKAFKALLTWNDRPFRRTHDVVDLVRQCAELDPAFARFEDAGKQLEPYAAEVRYPHELPDPSLEEATAARQRAREAFDFVLARVPPKTWP